MGARALEPRIASSAAPWALTGAFLLGLSIAFVVRSFALHEAVAAAAAR